MNRLNMPLRLLRKLLHCFSKATTPLKNIYCTLKINSSKYCTPENKQTKTILKQAFLSLDTNLSKLKLWEATFGDQASYSMSLLRKQFR